MVARLLEALRLVHVNFETLERTPKDSATFYADVIASRGAALADAH